MERSNIRPYKNDGEYVEAMGDLALKWIALYKQYAIELKPDGTLRQVKGQVTYGVDLELSMKTFFPEEIAEYEKEAGFLREWMKEIRRRGRASWQSGIPIPLEYLFQVLDSTEEERFLVMMMMAAETEPNMERVYGVLQDDYSKKYPSLDLCLRIYTLDRQKQHEILKNVLSQNSSFHYFLNEKISTRTGQLRLHPRILQFLWNCDETGNEVKAYAAPVVRPAEETVIEAVTKEGSLAQNLKKLLAEKKEPWVCGLYGPEGAGKKTIVNCTAALSGQIVIHVDLKKTGEDRKKAMENAVREVRIRNAWPCIDNYQLLMKDEEEENKVQGEKEEWIQTFLQVSDVVFFTSEKRWKGNLDAKGTAFGLWEVAAPTVEEQIRYWELLLAKRGPDGVTAEGMTVRFSLTFGQIDHAVKEAEGKRQARGLERMTKEDLYVACRQQLVMNLSRHVTRIETKYKWEDLILPPRSKLELRRACDQVEYRHKVYHTWGFGNKIAYGKGVSMLFYGPPGTGKTMGAQVMANTLDMELYKVDLSSVMSKYIGETEKNLGIIFDEIRKSRSILFFDEADALFGKRTEVKDSHDKYANAETAYLLQKMEEYEGIVVLATNYMQNFDEAFKRRIKFIIEFPFPPAKSREQMWEQIFPPEMPMEEIDVEFLAEKFELSGSSIKNIASAAAFLAAGEGENVSMKHILTALRAEMMKSGKHMPIEVFGEYSSLLIERENGYGFI